MAPAPGGAGLAAPGSFEPGLTLSAGQGFDGQIEGALLATANQFFGGPSPPGGGGGGGIGLDPGMFSPSSTTPHRHTRNRSLALSGTLERPLGAGVSARGTLEIAAADSRYVLPEGLGVAIDPTTVGFTSVSLAPQLGLVWRGPLPGPRRGHVALGVGAGQEVARIRTTLRSALLDVTNHSTQSSRFLELSAGLGLDPARQGAVTTDLILRARRYDGERVTVAGALRFAR